MDAAAHSLTVTFLIKSYSELKLTLSNTGISKSAINATELTLNERETANQ